MQDSAESWVHLCLERYIPRLSHCTGPLWITPSSLPFSLPPSLFLSFLPQDLLIAKCKPSPSLLCQGQRNETQRDSCPQDIDSQRARERPTTHRMNKQAVSKKAKQGVLAEIRVSLTFCTKVKYKIKDKMNWWVSGGRESLAKGRGHADAKRVKQQPGVGRR